MAGKEHRSGPVIRHILPVFWIPFHANVRSDILKGPVKQVHAIRIQESGDWSRMELFWGGNRFGRKKESRVRWKDRNACVECYLRRWALGRTHETCGAKVGKEKRSPGTTCQWNLW
ncbi:hypothetical protein NPIL_657721 [Nephila pilipes]|uniref:Uncharacterized protein n=1 Tax=Nephila pilipes TaxID=299642 RepID=A0A8X6NT83_NEPPI|nr:hypothetical protein NPIL_657721 [Nephila pilipes]